MMNLQLPPHYCIALVSGSCFSNHNQMTKEELEIAKQKMKDYRDLFGGELCRKDLIDDAKNIIDLDDIFAKHFDFINDMARDAESSLSKFKREIGVF